MASRFDTWSPIGPIELPVEAYMAAGAVNEQKTKEALASIASTYYDYQNITPFGANAKALHAQTMDGLKAKMEDVAKMDLNTPEAKRKFNQMLSDRGVINPLKQIMQHSLSAAARKKELDEYRKKESEVNATDYLTAFNQTESETGDPNQFKADRFSNLSSLGDYYDVNKRMEEGIARIESDEKLVKDIVGPYYIEEMRSGRGKNKIREYVAKSLDNDELVKGQVVQNLKYQYYKSNPQDLKDGRTKYASSLRENFITKSAELTTQRDNLKGMAAKEKDPGKKMELNNAVTQVSNMLDDMGKTYSPEVLNNDDAIGYMAIRENMIKGFDAFAKEKYHMKKTFNPEYLANLSFQHRAELQKRSQAHREKMVKKAVEEEGDGGVLPLTRMGAVEQAEMSPDDMGKYVNTIMPGVVLDKNGGFSKENFMRTSFNPDLHVSVQERPDGKGPSIPNDVVYNKSDIVVPKNAMEAKRLEEQGYKKRSMNVFQDHKVEGGMFNPQSNLIKGVRSFTNEMGRTFGFNNGDVYVKPGAKAVNKNDKSGEANYEAARAKIKSRYEAMSPTGSTVNPFKTDADYQKALDVVVGATQNWEKTYNQTFTIPGLSNSKDLKNTVAGDIPNMDMVDEKGKKITDRAAKLKIATELNANANATLGFANFNRVLGVPVYTFTTSEGTFSVPMHREIGAGFAGSANAVRMLINNNYNPVAANEDLFVNSVKDDGKGGFTTAAGVIKGGGTPEYDRLAQAHHFRNQQAIISRVKVSFNDADKILANGYEKAIDTRDKAIATAEASGNPATIRAAHNAPFYINAGTEKNPLMVAIAVPIIKKGGRHYSEAILPDLNGISAKQYGTYDFETNTKMEVQNTLNPNNAYIKGYYFKTGLANKYLRGDLMSDGYEGGGPSMDIPNILPE